MGQSMVKRGGGEWVVHKSGEKGSQCLWELERSLECHLIAYMV